MSSSLEFASDGTTLVDVVAGYEQDGYTGQMAATEDGRIRCLVCREESDPCDASVDALRRTEGASDPADMAAVVAMCCPRCGAKGTLVLKYGPEASPEEVAVLHAIGDDTRRSDDRAQGGIGAGGGGMTADHEVPES